VNSWPVFACLLLTQPCGGRARPPADDRLSDRSHTGGWFVVAWGKGGR
jgi:hypothetical protein